MTLAHPAGMKRLIVACEALKAAAQLRVSRRCVCQENEKRCVGQSCAINEALQLCSNTTTAQHTNHCLLQTKRTLKMMMKMMKMMMVVVCVCLMSLGGFSAASSLSCRWMDQKFTQHSEDSLKLIKTMVSELLHFCSITLLLYLSVYFIMCVCVCVMQANNSTNTTENTVDFPNELYSQAAKASVRKPQLLSL